MSFVHFAKKEVVLKLVFYGAAESGKTTNLQFLYKTLNPKYRGDMVVLDTIGERTLFFDFVPLSLGEVMGFKLKFQLYTVPGQECYTASRRLVLDGVDGLVFVVDSQNARMKDNCDSWHDLQEHLAFYGIDPAVLPIIVQYNKRDLPDVMDIGAFEREVKIRGHYPVFQAVATEGKGVFNSVKAISKLVVERLKFGE